MLHVYAACDVPRCEGRQELALAESLAKLPYGMTPTVNGELIHVHHWRIHEGRYICPKHRKLKPVAL